MDIKVKDKVNQRHVGRNLQRIRVYLGMKQEALASDLGVSQQEISKIDARTANTIKNVAVPPIGGRREAVGARSPSPSEIASGCAFSWVF